MKVILAGSLADGLRIVGVLQDDENPKKRHLKAGKIVDVLQVFGPETIIERKKYRAKEKDANVFVIFTTGLGSGASVYGPFDDTDIAGEFAEDTRSDGEEWEFMEFKKEPSYHFTGILLHNIRWWVDGNLDPAELDEVSVEHIEKCIKEGYREGELCVTVPNPMSPEKDVDMLEFRGWWSIDKK